MNTHIIRTIYSISPLVKTIHKITLSAFAFVLIIQVSFAALSKDDAAMILNNFKNQEKEMIFESDKVLLTEEDKNILSTYQRIGVFDTI